MTTLSNILTTDYIQNDEFNNNNSKIESIYNKGVGVSGSITGNASNWVADIDTLQNDLGEIDNSINTSHYIDEFKQILTSTTGQDELNIMDASYNDNSILVNDYEKERKHLKNRLKSYHSIVGQLKDAKMNKYYFLFIIWIIIFFIILFTLFFNIVEEQKSMNILSKGLLFIFVLYVLYYILKNIYLYFNGYR